MGAVGEGPFLAGLGEARGPQGASYKQDGAPEERRVVGKDP